ncbi:MULTISPECIES: hypothetical protein [unclassified Arthrobacter]|uniref:hypothetical protein n=1 Tax=unclassified Arthrobacter TaxID=235627 RepID=UPI003397292A
MLRALAYHWQFARRGSPHPGTLEECLLTPVLNNAPCTEAGPWVGTRKQHAGFTDHPACATKLTRWLTQQSTDTTADEDLQSTGASTYLAQGLHSFLTFPFDA